MVQEQQESLRGWQRLGSLLGATPGKRAPEKTLNKLKRLKKGSRINIRNTELLKGKQNKATRSSGDKKRAQRTVLVLSMN